MRDYQIELENRVKFIQNILKESHADGIVFGNSGGKDSALVGILCKKACENTLSVPMPCHSKRNFGIDLDDGNELSEKFGIENITFDLTSVRQALVDTLSAKLELNNTALTNIAPRLRMTTLYAVAACRNMLVAGTGNKDEYYMGYFTKWGDGAYDFNPIADLSVAEIYEFLAYLDAPRSIIEKAPSAGLFEGQTDEDEMGVTYAAIEKYIETGEATPHDREIIDRYHTRSEHKRRTPEKYGVTE